MIDSSSVLPDDELERLERELERDIQGLESPSHSVYAHSQPQNQQNNNLFTIEPGTSFSFGLDSFSHQNNQPNQINTSTNQDSISFIGSQLDDLSLRSQQRIAALNSSTNTSTKQYDDSASNIRKSIEKLLQEPLKHVSPSNRSSAPLTPKHHPIITVTTQSTPRTSINSLNNNLDSRPRDAMGILSSSPTSSHQQLASSDRFVNAAPLPTYERGRSIQSSFSSVQKSGNAAANSFSQDRTPQQHSARSSSVGLSTVSPKRTLSGSRNMKEQTHIQQLVQSGTANRSNSNIFKPSSSGSQPTPSSYQHNPSFQKLLPKSPEKDHISSTGDLKSRRSLNSTAANASSMTTINNPHEQNFGTRPTHNKQAPKQAQTQQLQQQQQTPKRVEDDISDRLDALIADELANVEMILDSAHTSLTPSPVSMKTNNQTGYQPFNNRPKPLSIASRGASLKQSRKNLPQQQGFGSSPVPTAVESRQRDGNENRSRAVSMSPSRAELIEEAQRLVGSGRDVSRERAEQTGYESRKKPEERSREVSMSPSRVKLVEEAPWFVVRGRGESKDRERNPTSSMGSLTKGLEDRGRDGSIQNRSRSVSMSPSRAELVEEAQRFVGRGRELSRERESSREGSRVSLTSQCRFDDGHNGRVVVDNVSKQQQQSQRNGEDDERRERLARLARLHTREQIKSTVPVESGAENRGEQLARLANLHNRSPSTKDFTGQQPITQNDIKPPQTNRSIQGSRSILSPEKSTIPNSQRPTIESLRVQEWKKGRVDTESKTSLKSQPQDFAKSVSASREAVTYGAASNSGSRHALNAGGRQSRSVTPPIVEQATRLSATDGLNVQSSRTSSRSPSRITLSPDYDFRIGSDERESRNAAPPSEYASRAHSRSSSRHALNNQRPPSRTMSRSPSRPTLSPDYDVRPGAEMREALHAGPPPPNDVPTSRQHSRSPSRQQINDPSPMQHQPRESMGKTASLSYMSSVKSDSVTQFGSVGYMSAQVSAGNLAKSHSYSEPTLSSHGNSREGGSGAWHFERRESIREQFGAMEEQRAHSMNVQITKQAQIDTNKLQPVLPASGITRSKSPVGSGRLRSSSPLREAFGIHDQSEPEHFAEPSPIRSENTLSESAKNYQDIVDEVKKPPMFEKPPLPPSIRTSSNDLKPSKVSIEQLGVNSSVSRQSSFNSLHSAHLTPNLANLANPQGKASLMNLHDQGPAIIPSVVDKVEDGIQRRPVAHLPVDEGSRAVVNALRTLQEKVSKLEGEKENAKSVIQNLESDLVTTRQLLQHERSRVNSTVNSSVRETPSIPAASLPQQASPTSASSSHVHYENHEVDDFDFSRKIGL
ncbi:hypothetical protein BCR33DRAFT_357012 [Rhizoclosmatium globosum]|uniref:Cep57 centrosome localisation domain-containing protein n=1 Tax=Rhizoclosmatium globosum TaxID=329046 RepID=A0A1Y2C105_9FUNG|nr:hypothetical protein BCR33DRAFT_357012 [Rhizoclosmatium globosum]|eukprot:ORY40708.1 hypothetical protein BCR33DRAFT_357012 [Rhizoclosmatium globosum]